MLREIPGFAGVQKSLRSPSAVWLFTFADICLRVPFTEPVLADVLLLRCRALTWVGFGGATSEIGAAFGKLATTIGLASSGLLEGIA